MRKIVLTILGFVLVAVSFFGAKTIIANKKKPKPRIEQVVKTVFVETAKNTEIPIIISSNGTVTAKNRLELFAETQGVFRSSAHEFKAGQEYRRGQTLLSIDASEFYASVQASRSDFKNLVASILPDLRLDYPAAFPTWEAYLNGITSENSLPELPSIPSDNVNYFITGRGIQAAYFNTKNLEQRLGKFRIVAPFNGVLTEALVTKGTLIRQGQKLGEFIDTSLFEVELAVAKEYSDLLKNGERVVLKAIDNEKRYTGKVIRVNERIDQATQTIKVFVEVKGEGITEGMYLEADLDARKEQNAIKVPRKLLVDESQLFVVRDSVLDVITVQPVHFSAKEVVDAKVSLVLGEIFWQAALQASSSVARRRNCPAFTETVG